MASSKEIIENRLSYIESAQKIGISQTAAVFNVSRKTISLWLRRFEEGGLAAISNKSRKTQNHPSRMKQEYLDTIISLKKIHPDWNAARIKKEANIPHAVTTIIKKLHQLKDTENIIHSEQEYTTSDFLLNIHKTTTASGDKCLILQIKNMANNLVYYGYSKLYELYALKLFLSNVLSELVDNDRPVNILIASKSLYNNLINSELIKLAVQHYNTRILKCDLSCNTEILNYFRQHQHNNPLGILYQKQIENNEKVLKSIPKKDKKLLLFFLKFSLDLDFFAEHQNEKLQKEYWQTNEHRSIDLCKFKHLLCNDAYPHILRHTEILYRVLSEKYNINTDLFRVFIENNKNSKNKEFIKICSSLYRYSENLYIKTEAAIQLSQHNLDLNKLNLVKKIIIPALEWAKSLKSEYLIWEAKSVIARLYYRQGLYRESISYLSKQYTYAWKYNDEHRIITVLLDLCRAEIDYGNYQTALDKMTEPKLHHIVEDNQILETKLLGLKTRAYIGLHQKKEAKVSISAYSNLADALQLKREKLKALSYFGKLSIEEGKYNESEEYFKKYFVLALKSKNNRFINDAYTNLGKVYWYKKMYNKSLYNYQKAHHIAIKLGDKFNLAKTIGDLALVHNAMENYNKSLEVSRRYLRLANQLQNNSFASFAYGYMGLAYMELNDLKRAKYYFMKQMKISKIINDKQNTAFSYTNLAIISFQLDQRKSAIIYFNRSLKILEEMNSRFSVDIRLNIITYYMTVNNPKRAQKELLLCIDAAKKYAFTDLDDTFAEFEKNIAALIENEKNKL